MGGEGREQLQELTMPACLGAGYDDEKVVRLTKYIAVAERASQSDKG